MGEYCSPLSINNNTNKNSSKTCFSKESLIKLIEAWNTTNSNNKIKYKSKDSIKTLWNFLNNKLKGICDEGKDWCWTGALKNMTSNSEIKNEIKNIANKELIPEKPLEWMKNPKTWLSNYDIEEVMVQYEQNKQYKYKFIGVFPIDFTVKNKFGKCLYSELCSIDVLKYSKKGIKYLGIITNLDKHDQPGSHWTSTFIVIDPKIKSYGAYYYDSTARPIPSYMLNLLKEIKNQCNNLYPDNNFNYIYNKKQHQRKNTECGVFSIVFQIRWLKFLKMNKNNASFDKVINDKDINDETMYSVRDKLFRPPVIKINKNK
jgi:hypothetical protein